MSARTDPKFRFQGKFEIIPESGCWIWMGATRSTNYGSFRDDSFKGSKNVSAHRASYEIYVGKIPDGMLVLHRCDVPLCVNPSHLFLGTHLSNAKDRNAKGREAHQRGEEQGAAKLTWEKVEKLRKDNRTYAVLSKEYGICIANISKIKNNKGWIRP